MFKDLPSRIRTIYRKAKLSYNLVNQVATDNPKVSAYLPPAVYDVPPAVYDELEAFKEQRGLQSVEMAVTTILAEYFGQLQPSLNPATDTTSRLESLEAKCSSLSEMVAELQTAIATLQATNRPQLDQSQIVEPTTEISHIDYSESPVSSEQLDQTAHLDLPDSTNSLLIQPLQPQNNTLDNLGAEDLSKMEVEPLAQPSSHGPMTQAALARRLEVSTSSISRMQSKPNFPEWSQQKDPEGIAWVRSPKTKEFYPQNHK